MRNSSSPPGRPSILYYRPALAAATHHGFQCNENDLVFCKNESLFRDTVPCDNDVFEVCTILMARNRLVYPSSNDQALHTYLSLRQSAKDVMRL